MSTRLCKASRERSPESVTNPGGRIVSNRDEMKKKKLSEMRIGRMVF